MSESNVVSVYLAAVGGQGLVTASEVIALALFNAGFDVKSSVLKGLSRRCGSVLGSVRFGNKVLSPCISRKGADFLVLIDPGQLDVCRGFLADSGKVIMPSMVNLAGLENGRGLNIALCGVLARALEQEPDNWLRAVRQVLGSDTRNEQAFLLGFG